MVVGSGGGKEAGDCKDANLMHPITALGQEMGAEFHCDLSFSVSGNRL